ncbi:hypothetical protein DL546_008803 [Coniochaeta pulveracea]|uniref:Uncharacterized protein n=1 Tax=Coniochaeta pulveracea TaxID=177199 RepID=A0A420YKG7_9PEZI|nr:hypothetical protein DL546_008803 [Coniochaeta pulveracea]
MARSTAMSLLMERPIAYSQSKVLQPRVSRWFKADRHLCPDNLLISTETNPQKITRLHLAQSEHYCWKSFQEDMLQDSTDCQPPCASHQDQTLAGVEEGGTAGIDECE